MKWCKPCRSAYDKMRYKTFDKQRQQQKSKDVRERNARFLLGYLLDKGCCDCGENDPLVLDFDHKQDKHKNVSDMVRGGHSIQRLKQEIEKCDIRCANCHRRKTALEQNWYKVRFSEEAK